MQRAPENPNAQERLNLAMPSPPRPATRLESARNNLYFLLAGLPALAFLLAALAPPINHDVAAVLNFSGRWLQGERLYVDLIDVNPPLIFVLNIIPAALAEILPLTAVQCFILCVLLLMLGAAMLTLRVLAALRLAPLLRHVTQAAMALTLLGAGYDFGQREHLMLIMALP